eukprot:gene611-8115_t
METDKIKEFCENPNPHCGMETNLGKIDFSGLKKRSGEYHDTDKLDNNYYVNICEDAKKSCSWKKSPSISAGKKYCFWLGELDQQSFKLIDPFDATKGVRQTCKGGLYFRFPAVTYIDHICEDRNVPELPVYSKMKPFSLVSQ